LFEEMVAVYCEDAPKRLQAIQTAIAQSNPEELRQAAHALNSGSISLGAVRVAQLCESLEKMGKSGRISDAETLWLQLPEAVNQALNELKSITYQPQLAAA
jgi:HPt (histidine-containing phosphotransfer) domain-containing protein